MPVEGREKRIRSSRPISKQQKCVKALGCAFMCKANFTQVFMFMTILGQKCQPFSEKYQRGKEFEEIFHTAGEQKRNPISISLTFLCPSGFYPFSRHQMKNACSWKGWKKTIITLTHPRSTQRRIGLWVSRRTGAASVVLGLTMARKQSCFSPCRYLLTRGIRLGAPYFG